MLYLRINALFPATEQLSVPNPGHASGMIDLDISPDGACLVAVGLDSQNRQSIVIWDIKGVKQGKGVRPNCHTETISMIRLTVRTNQTNRRASKADLRKYC